MIVVQRNKQLCSDLQEFFLFDREVVTSDTDIRVDLKGF
jgi:hypothetical protein